MIIFQVLSGTKEDATLSLMLPRRNRLSSTYFERAFNKSQVVRHALVQVRAHRRGDTSDEVRAAFVVPKKQGKAHDRNRTRRRLRERFRLHPRRDDARLRGCDLIFLTVPGTATATNEELDTALDEVLRRLGGRMSSGDDPGARERPQKRPTAVPPPQESEGESAPTEAPPPALEFKRAPVSWVFIEAIRFYQRAVSPSLPPSCRFFPSCSAYTATAIERHGPFWGVALGAWRICRCTPLCKGGFDPVPETLSPRFASPWLGLSPKDKTSKTGRLR